MPRYRAGLTGSSGKNMAMRVWEDDAPDLASAILQAETDYPGFSVHHMDTVSEGVTDEGRATQDSGVADFVKGKR